MKRSILSLILLLAVSLPRGPLSASSVVDSITRIETPKRQSWLIPCAYAIVTGVVGTGLAAYFKAPLPEGTAVAAAIGLVMGGISNFADNRIARKRFPKAIGLLNELDGHLQLLPKQFDQFAFEGAPLVARITLLNDGALFFAMKKGEWQEFLAQREGQAWFRNFNAQVQRMKEYYDLFRYMGDEVCAIVARAIYLAEKVDAGFKLPLEGLQEDDLAYIELNAQKFQNVGTRQLP